MKQERRCLGRVVAIMSFSALMTTPFPVVEAVEFRAGEVTTSLGLGSDSSLYGPGYKVSGYNFRGPAALGVKTVAGVNALGVAGGPTACELDNTGESLLVQFDQPSMIREFTISLLYPKGEFGDQQNESAWVQVNDSELVFRLEALGYCCAAWTGVGMVTNLSPAQDGIGEDGILGGGSFQVSNPFGLIPVQTLRFFTVSPVPGAQGSDYGLTSVTAGPLRVPDAGGTLLLLAMGSLAVLARRPRRA